MSDGSQQHVVDLTDETSTRQAPVLQKKRTLPATVLLPSNSQAQSAVRSSLPLPSISSLPTTSRSLPPSVTHLPSAVRPSNQTTSIVANVRAATSAAVPNARIVFSIVNSRQFTARAEGGTVSPAVVATFKLIPDAKFDWQTCKWLFPLHVHDNLQVALRTQHRHYVEPLPRLTLAAAQLKNQREEQQALSGGAWNPEESLFALKGHIPDSVLHQLAPFQRDAVKFIMSNKGRALVADEMGLGKTRTAISAAMAYRDDWPVLVVCPSSARHHWQAELLAVLHPDHLDPRDISIVENNSHPIYKGAQGFKYKVLIISYHLLAKVTDTLLAIPFNVVIVDESHYMKSHTAQRTKSLMPILHKSRRALLLSGTPALSRPIELFTQLHALAPQQWNDLKAFGKRYCTASKSELRARQLLAQQQQGASGFSSGFGASGASLSKSWSEFSGASNMEELHLMLTATIMIRRLKKDILAQLPQKKRRIVRVGISDPAKHAELQEMLTLSATYNQRVAAHKKSRSEGEARQREVLELEELRQRKKHVLLQLFTMSGEAKLPGVLKHLEAFLDDPLSGKILVFCHHRAVMDGIARLLTQRGEEFIRIDGQTASKDRHSRVQQFQTSSQCRVAVLAITAAGIALTLTAASTVYFAELFWTPAALLQAEDRAHRIGQVNTVTVTYFLAAGSVDALLWPMVRQKMKLLGEIVEGSKDGDFLADLEGPPDDDPLPRPTSAASGSGGVGVAVGSKRVKQDPSEEGQDDVDGFQEAEVGELAQEIAAELRASARSAHKGSSESSDAEDSTDEGGGADDDAVVPIEEPDPLALLYMSMVRSKSRGNGLGGGSASGGSSSGRLSDATSGQGVKNGGAPVVVSLMSDETATSGNAVAAVGQSIPYVAGQVIDLFGEEDQEFIPRQVDSEEAVKTEYEVEGVGTDMGVDMSERDTGYVDGAHRSVADTAEGFYEADELPPTELEGGDKPDQQQQPASVFDFDSWVSAPAPPPPPLSSSVLSNIVQDEDATSGSQYSHGHSHSHSGPSKQQLKAMAQRAWSSAVPTQTPKNNKFAGKFAPTLKKVDRNDSSSSLGGMAQRIEEIVVSPPLVATKDGADRPVPTDDVAREGAAASFHHKVSLHLLHDRSSMNVVVLLVLLSLNAAVAFNNVFFKPRLVNMASKGSYSCGSPVQRLGATVVEQPTEQYKFESNVARVMDIIINSLYSNKDVFIRELVSNAADACDKKRFLTLTNGTSPEELNIRISADREKNTLTIEDRGIGMNKEELIQNLGRIAESGTKRFLENVGQKKDEMSLIGQFGVGFYSAFLVANKVEVITKGTSGEQLRWSASADSLGQYTISPDTSEPIATTGTRLVLHLKDECDQYLDDVALRALLEKYSEFIAFPIQLQRNVTKPQSVPDASAPVEADGTIPMKTVMQKVQEWVVVNEKKPLWLRAPKTCTTDEYTEFYRQTFKAYDTPLGVSHFSMEGNVDFKALLYLPEEVPYELTRDMFASSARSMRLYVKRVFINDKFEDLIPRWLLFLRGVVDSDDLPLNVGREILQQSRSLRIIKQRLVKKSIEMMDDLAARNETQYQDFWRKFGKYVKVGIIEDEKHRPDLAPLCRFYTSHKPNTTSTSTGAGADASSVAADIQSEGAGRMASLGEYVARMPEGQTSIYYVVGDTRAQAAKSPTLEKLRQKGYEVIYLTEPIDEMTLQNIETFQGKTIVDAGKETSQELSEEERQTKQAHNEESEAFRHWMKDVLGDKITRVEASTRLVDSPATLVQSEYGVSPSMQKYLRAQAVMEDDNKGQFSNIFNQAVLEVNMLHPIIAALRKMHERDASSTEAKETAELVFSTAALAAGYSLDNAADYAQAVVKLMTAAATGAATQGV